MIPRVSLNLSEVYPLSFLNRHISVLNFENQSKFSTNAAAGIIFTQFPITPIYIIHFKFYQYEKSIVFDGGICICWYCSYGSA